jgi:hypothetical protein
LSAGSNLGRQQLPPPHKTVANRQSLRPVSKLAASVDRATEMVKKIRR